MADINDIVLVYFEDTPVFFARVESILPDRKKDWYQIKLLMLQIPLQTATWILKDEYINGEEFFMNKKKMRLEKVICPPDPIPLEESVKQLKKDALPGSPEEDDSGTLEKQDSAPSEDEDTPAEIISFADLKNERKQP